MKIVGLDLGDRWVGIALSDALGMTCRPYKTSTVEHIVDDLQSLFSQEPISRLVVGLPRTLKGQESDQTRRIRLQAHEVVEQLNIKLNKTIPLILWDERFSSKRAQSVGRQTGKKQDANHEHAVAAAFILQTYLDSCL